MSTEGQFNEVAVAPLRQEKVTMRTGITGYGGTLTLTQEKLVWKGSSWFYLERGLRFNPKKVIEFDLRAAQFSVGPRWPGLGVLLWPFSIVIEIVTGGLRKTVQVDTPDDFYLFAVQDADAWLQDIARARTQAAAR